MNMYSCIYGCAFDDVKTIEDLHEHYQNIHNDTETPWAVYDHTFLRHMPFAPHYDRNYKE